MPMQVETLTTFGLSQTAVIESLKDFERHFPQIRLATQDVFPEVHLHLSPKDPVSSRSEAMLKEAVDWSRQQLGVHFLSANGKSIEAVVGSLLRRRKESVAVAESCTGGLISHLLTNVAGSSDYFLMAAVTYANRAKRQLLGVSEETLRRCGAVHENTAAEMAAGIRRISGAAYGLATTGIAGPTGGSLEKPVGTLCVGLCGPEGVNSERFCFSYPERLMNKKIFAATALDMLRKTLLDVITVPVPGGGLSAGKPGESAT